MYISTSKIGTLASTEIFIKGRIEEVLYSSNPQVNLVGYVIDKKGRASRLYYYESTSGTPLNSIQLGILNLSPEAPKGYEHCTESYWVEQELESVKDPQPFMITGVKENSPVRARVLENLSILLDLATMGHPLYPTYADHFPERVSAAHTFRQRLCPLIRT